MLALSCCGGALFAQSPAQDFGDAPQSFPTLLSQDGARHGILQGFNLGRAVDAEQDGQPSSDAMGDDRTPAGALDDEDGVAFRSAIEAGKSVNLEVLATQSGRLDAWIDFNGNGNWADVGERIFDAQALSGGVNTLSFTVPQSATPGIRFARFRFSREGVESFRGPAPDGEVEDYQISIAGEPEQLDFGDAPDVPYPTTLKNNGARHGIVRGLNLGKTVDPERDGQPNAGATGDDAAPAGAADDEDGVVFPSTLTAGQPATVQVTVIGDGFLFAWVDFNANGTWADAGEQIFGPLPVTTGVTNLTFAVPAASKIGATFARFRLSRERQLPFFGPAEAGEVEDYEVKIEGELLDFGDAPELEQTGYPTTLARNGARHRILKGFHLGRIEDGEPDGQPNPAATGDDASGGPNDEDGVRFFGGLTPGVTAQVEVTTTAGGRLDAWIDFGRNLNWLDATDRIFTSQPLNPGANVLSFPVPASAQSGVTFARFRLSREGQLRFDGDGGPGEVEDLTVRIERATPCDLGCEGREFWLTFPGNYAPDPANPVRPKLLIVGPRGTTVAVSIPGISPAFLTNVTISASMFVEVNLPRAADLGDTNDSIEKNGVHVVASQPVSVHALSKVEFTSDGYLALPIEVLGLEHYVLAYANAHAAVPELDGSQFAIVATETNTTVTIVPSVITGARDSDVPYTIVLNAGETYQLRTTTGAPADLTGTRITSDKPIAVFGGHSCANVNSKDVFFCDYLVEQLPAVNRWTTEFYTRRLATRSNGDALRVLAAQNNTVVSIDGATVATLNAGEFYETIRPVGSANATQIKATRPVLVAQYANSSDFDVVVNSDPFMSLVPGRSLFSLEHRFVAPTTGFLTHHINVIAPTAAAGSVTLDGAPLGGFSAIGSSGFSQTTATVSPGFHSVTASQPVGVNVYGWNQYESYGWPSCLFFGDTTPPVIECPPPIEVKLGESPAGAKLCEAPVPDLRGQVKFTDNCPRPPGTVAGGGVMQDPPPGTLLGPGEYEITLSVTDAAGNVGTCMTRFTVIDPNPDPDAKPVLHCPNDMVVRCTDEKGARVEFESFALIGCKRVPLECKPPSGSVFPIGTTTVTCVLPDSATGEPVECSFTVRVVCDAQPRLDFKLDRSNFTLTWTDSSVLQAADSPVGPWSDVLNASGQFTFDTTQSKQKFFRLRAGR